MNKPMWTVQDVCDYLNVSESWVRGMVEKGELPFIKLRKGKYAPIRFRESEIVEYYRSNGIKEIL